MTVPRTTLTSTTAIHSQRSMNGVCIGLISFGNFVARTGARISGSVQWIIAAGAGVSTYRVRHPAALLRGIAQLGATISIPRRAQFTQAVHEERLTSIRPPGPGARPGHRPPIVLSTLYLRPSAWLLVVSADRAYDVGHSSAADS